MASHGSSFQKIFSGAAGTSSDTLTSDNVFSIDLYTGNGGTPQVITNNIDLSGEGGMVWQKARSDAYDHKLTDTVRGTGKTLTSQANIPEQTQTCVDQFLSTGFRVGSEGDTNANNVTFCAWTFRRAPKFFDVVIYTGNGNSSRAINHSLGIIPGMIWIKKRSSGNESWIVFHRSISNASNGKNLFLDLNNSQDDMDGKFDGSNLPTDTTFTIEADNAVNAGNVTYVAYLFAHDTGDESLIKCDAYTGNANATGPVINLAFEPQFVMIKEATASGRWKMYDMMRDVGSGPGANRDANFSADQGDAEAFQEQIAFTSTGFQLRSTDGNHNSNNETYVYMAIKRPDRSDITDPRKVFKNATYTGNGSVKFVDCGFDVDMVWGRDGYQDNKNIFDRLRGSSSRLQLNSAAEHAPPSYDDAKQDACFDVSGGYTVGPTNSCIWNTNNTAYLQYAYQRAKGFFDIVLYKSTGNNITVNHNLGVVPGMMWVCSLDRGEGNIVYHGDPTNYLVLNTNAATVDDATYWNDTAPTETTFTIGTDNDVNYNVGSTTNITYVVYLFGTLAGVSKCGTVSHSGSSTDVDCGFSSGASFVMLKRTDSTGSWFFWDAESGIASGNDPYSLIDNGDAPVTNTDFIDPLSSGFQISGSFQDGSYFFWAIA